MQIKHIRQLSVLVLGFAMSVTPARAEDLPSRAEMWQMIQAQQAQINSLTSKLEDTDEKVEATGEVVEEIAAAGGSASEPGWWKSTSLGGYGELHYNGGDKDEVDFHRFVLFIAHEFSDSVRLFAELELEHALSGEGQNGEVELEQAYLEFDVAEYHSILAGVQLIPVGILNETHEPPTFYGVERNEVEKNIIPTTWWEAGIGGQGELGDGFSYNVLYHSGLQVPTTGGNAFKIRNGRQKVSQARASDGAVTGRVQWTGMPGVEVGVTAQHQFDVTQGTGEETAATLVEAHVDATMSAGPGQFGIRALAAYWDLDSTAAAAIGRDEQYGWYVEPSYRFATEIGDLGFFIQYAEWDNNGGDNTDSKFSQTRFGANFWPTPDTVVKADYQIDSAPTGGTEDDRVNLGVGFQF